MQIVTLVLLLLLTTVVSGFVVRVSPVTLPLPLVQISLGALLASLSSLHVELYPEVFFLVFLPPMLFLDGYRISKQEILRDLGTVLAMATGLVVFTVIGVGAFIHWLVPGEPLAAAFALAAVISSLQGVGAATLLPHRLTLLSATSMARAKGARSGLGVQRRSSGPAGAGAGRLAHRQRRMADNLPHQPAACACGRAPRVALLAAGCGRARPSAGPLGRAARHCRRDLCARPRIQPPAAAAGRPGR